PAGPAAALGRIAPERTRARARPGRTGGEHPFEDHHRRALIPAAHPGPQLPYRNGRAAIDMPGMSTGMETSGASAALVLAEITLFWTVTVLHVLRLLSPARLCDADRLEDAGHVAMGAGMTAMVFPGAPSTALRVMAVVFAVLAV